MKNRAVYRLFVLSLQGLACSAFSCLHQGFLKRSIPSPISQFALKSQRALNRHQFTFGAAENLKCSIKSSKRVNQVGLFAKASIGDENDGFWDIGDITEKLDKTVRQEKRMVRARVPCFFKRSTFLDLYCSHNTLLMSAALCVLMYPPLPKCIHENKRRKWLINEMGHRNHRKWILCCHEVCRLVKV